MPPHLTYQDALDHIFASYMKVKAGHAGKFDREIRQPEVIITLARALGALPAPERTIRITGSKGKGTTSRLVARYLKAELPEATVGLLVSPEEIEHTDRMQVNGTQISKSDFARIYAGLTPRLEALLAAMPEGGYLSPSGLFMLIALVWFAEQGVSHFVLETGRGVRHDEVGQIASDVSIVTSIMLEHAANLGPTIEHIAADKLSVAGNSDHLVCLPALYEAYEALIPAPPAPLAPARSLPSYPAWFAVNDRLARSAVNAHLGLEVTSEVELASPSFGWLAYRGIRIAYDAIINAASADRELYREAFTGKRTLILASLPDDKDRDGLFKLFGETGATVREIALTGTRGYLHYEKARGDGRLLAEVAFNDGKAFRKVLDDAVAELKPDVVYIAGTQTYIRLFKLALSDVYRG
jgi:dihydrofolate synthase/folylpolyglutamate synthase